ncbi:MAG: RidA family protein [Bacteroidetes bacterium]|nr:RidA family protein [Bacteroidota bacterium]
MAKKKIIYTDEAPDPIGPYNQAVMAGKTLYISGQIAIDAFSGAMISGDIKKETRQVMQNLRAILAAAGLTFNNVVKCSIFLANMDDFAAVNEIYGSYFDEDAPARETIAVRTLPKNVNVEISAIAVR